MMYQLISRILILNPIKGEMISTILLILFIVEQCIVVNKVIMGFETLHLKNYLLTIAIK